MKYEYSGRAILQSPLGPLHMEKEVQTVTLNLK